MKGVIAGLSSDSSSQEPEMGAVTKLFHLQSIRYLSATSHQAEEALGLCRFNRGDNNST